MPQASGVFKQLAYKAETTYGVIPAAASAQSLRRVTSDIDLRKDTYQSNEIRTDQQMQDMRHGVRRVEGTIAGELSPKTYADFIAAALRRDFTAGPSASSLSITIAGSGPTYTVTRSAGSWLTDGFKRGHVCRLTAGTFNVANLNKNLLVAGITATVLTVRVLNGSALVAEGPIASATCAVTGKQTFAPTTGHTNKSFSIEHWFSDIAQSEVYSGCQPNQIDLQMPPTGLATINIGMVGQGRTNAGSQYFTSPTAATATGLTASVNGLVLLGGVAIAVLTGLTLQIQSNRSGEPVVGSNVVPTMFPGRILASGQATAYFEDATFRNAFDNETELELIVVLSSDNSAASEFVGFTLPRVKLNGSAKSDGEGGIVQTIPYQALLPLTGGSGIANELTTVLCQDSAA
ncbi:MAG: hypothetical protein KF683_01415 [Rubrivivax sp.]|nr:hypothetical protein [Rubrivivax sp.]